MKTQYDEQAARFLTDHHLTLTTTFKGDKCPPWDDGACTHGDRYRVTIRRKNDRRALSFDFWNSLHDQQTGQSLTAYDVLANISADAFLPEDPDELIEELGVMPIKQALASVRFTKRLRAFFSERELDALGEIH